MLYLYFEVYIYFFSFFFCYDKSPVPPIRERRLDEPLPDPEVLEAVLELGVGHPDREALRGVLSGRVEVEPELAEPLKRLRRRGIGILQSGFVFLVKQMQRGVL